MAGKTLRDTGIYQSCQHLLTGKKYCVFLPKILIKEIRDGNKILVVIQRNFH